MKMGFSSSGHSRTGHEALLARQDAELRLLDNMKRCLTAKVKSDREYALALSSVANVGQKMDKCEDLSGSAIASAWRTMTEEWESASRLMKLNADSLEGRALDKLSSLLAERRRARKLYQEDHVRISSQFTQLVEEVSKKQGEYQKCLESYKQMRTKFEENYLKCPTTRGGRKLDETRDKYGKACRRLHRAHNEYVLLLAEAGECERALRENALPALADLHQKAADQLLQSCRGILVEVVQRSDFTSEKFREIQTKIEATVQNLKPHEDYKEFIEKYKSSPPSPVTFTFDESLVDDTSGKLLPNQLTVDNLTVDWLREKLADLEAQVHDVKEKITSTLATNNVTNGVCKNNNGTPIANGVNGHDRHSPPPTPPLNNVESIKVVEMRILERKWMKQAEIIRTALAELGCEEAPSGCPDLSTDNVGPDSLDGSSVDHQIISTTHERSLVDEEWFHGVLPREEVVRLLRADGDYLVRETTRNDERQTVLSVCWGGHKHFIVQTTPEGHFRFEGLSFPSVAELIAWQRSCGAAVTARSGAVLRRAVPRERWELNNDDVLLLDKIGRGNFGDVYKARLKSTNQEVAVKTCRITLPEEQKRTFLQEGRILKQYDHPNIVRLIGICVQKQPIMIVMELVTGGSLLTFLRSRASGLSQKQLLGMCRDAAGGMRYLEGKNCIHRDLAARNCLVGQDNIVKISDFGMSREEEEYIVSGGMKQIPIKWTAPEALNFGKYTSLCDVWSYGILMWEIFSKGDTPYSGLSNSRAREKIDAGYRMPCPESCTEDVYRLMLRCWEYEPENRPHFDQIYSTIDNLYSSW